MRLNPVGCIAFAVAAMCSAAHATTFTFDKDPFAGTNVLNTPGRQIIGGEDFLSFSTSRDIFSLESTVFGTGNTVNFVNSTAPNIPSSGVNIVVLETFDNDNNPLTPFGAGNAADLIASEITTPGPGFFVYFNQSLNLPRLVFSADLSDNNADLKVLARMLNLTGQDGRNALPTFTAANFAITTTATAAPEPSSLSMFGAFGLIGAGYSVLRRKRAPERASAATPKITRASVR
jgi:hypothetical protein